MCLYYDANGQERREARTAITWQGNDTLEAVGLPRVISAGTSITVPGLILPPRCERLRIQYQLPKVVTVSSSSDVSDEPHTILVENPGRTSRSVSITFSLAKNVDLPHRRAYPVALEVWRLMEADWFARSRVGFLAGAAVLTVLLLANGIWGAVAGQAAPIGLSAGQSFLGAFISALFGAVASQPVWHALALKGILPLPTQTSHVGRLEHPSMAVTLTPPPREVAPATHAAIDDYRMRLSKRLKSLRILDMGQALDLEQAYIPTRLARVFGPDSRVADPDLELAAAAEDPRRRDQVVDHQTTMRHSTEDVLRESRHVVVTGEVGAGKTMMLRRLAVSMAGEESERLPLYVELFRFEPPSDMENIVEHLLNSLVERLIPTEDVTASDVEALVIYIHERLSEGSAAILWDGLDEVSGPIEGVQERLNGTLKVMEKLAETFPLAPMIVTCRTASTERYRRLESSHAVLGNYRI